MPGRWGTLVTRGTAGGGLVDVVVMAVTSTRRWRLLLLQLGEELGGGPVDGDDAVLVGHYLVQLSHLLLQLLPLLPGVASPSA